MKSIYPIQKFVETEGDVVARNLADALHEKIVQSLYLIPEGFEEQAHRFSSEEILSTIQPALTWKVMEKLAAQLQTSAEGWCEVYYRALKRRYEGE